MGTIKIAQISDLHFRGHQRHDEYVAVFEKLYEQLLEKEVNAIVCTGDIFHTKTQNITPEVIDKLVWMFSSLAKIAPLHVMLGNHDGNLANEDRQDAISPIINAMKNPNIYLYKKSGVYPLYANVGYMAEDGYDYKGGWVISKTKIGWLSVFSLFDKEGWPNVSPKKEDLFNIALFHGSVNGCVTDGDFKLTECETNVSNFEKYDLAMLGDIHKFQFLGRRQTSVGKIVPWIAYPGSLIQQDYGELEKKGWLLWSLDYPCYKTRTWDVEFIQVENEMAFITIPWKDTTEETIKGLLELKGTDVKNKRIRIVTKQNISQLEASILHKEIKEKLGAYEVTYKQEESKNINAVETATISVLKQDLRSDSEAMRKLYSEYVKTSDGKFKLTDKQLERASVKIDEYMKNLLSVQDEDVIRNVVWSLKGIEFNNLFCYGEDNKLNFQNMNGIVGIFADNGAGKSSVVGAIMYALYNATDRGPIKSAFIINKKKKEGSARVLINVGGVDYVINRKTTKSNSRKGSVEEQDKAATSLQFHKMTVDGGMVEVTNENDIKRSDTDKVVRRLIGSSEDFLMTAFSSQGGMNKFIEEGATVRKEILNRFLDLDIFKKLFQYADKDYSAVEAKAQRYNISEWETVVLKTEKELNERKIRAEIVKEILVESKNNLDNIKLWLKDNQNIDQRALNQKLNDLEMKISVLRREVSSLEKVLENTKTAKENLLSDTIKLEAFLSEQDADNLQDSIKILSNLRKNLMELKSNLSVDKLKLETMRKSIRKLDIVPCGDNYPECHFIKDSHEDKKNIAQKEEVVKNLIDSLTASENTVKEMENEKYEEKLARINKVNQGLALLKQKLPSLEKEIELVLVNLKSANENLKVKEAEFFEIKDKLDLSNVRLFNEKTMELSICEKNIAAKEAEFQTLLMQIGGNESRLAQIEKEKEDSKTIFEDFKIYDSIKEAFSKNGIPALILKTQLPAINLEIEKILTGFDDFKITLETEYNSTNTLDVFITSKGTKKPIEICSGAEKMMASLAMRVALLNLSNLSKPDLFIVDESFGCLDQKNMPKVLQLLNLLKSRFKIVLVISHIPEIKEVADKIIEIKISNEESSIQA